MGSPMDQRQPSAKRIQHESYSMSPLELSRFRLPQLQSHAQNRRLERHFQSPVLVTHYKIEGSNAILKVLLLRTI